MHAKALAGPMTLAQRLFPGSELAISDVDVCAQYFVKLLGLVSAMLASLWLVGRCVKPARQAAPSPPSPPRPRSPTMMLLALRAEASACTRSRRTLTQDRRATTIFWRALLLLPRIYLAHGIM